MRQFNKLLLTFLVREMVIGARFPIIRPAYGLLSGLGGYALVIMVRNTEKIDASYFHGVLTMDFDSNTIDQNHPLGSVRFDN